jgi:hypothetical protein
VKKADRAKKSMAYKEDTMDEDEEFLDGKDETNGHAPGQEDEEDEEEGDDDEEPEEYGATLHSHTLLVARLTSTQIRRREDLVPSIPSGS